MRIRKKGPAKRSKGRNEIEKAGPHEGTTSWQVLTTVAFYLVQVRSLNPSVRWATNTGLEMTVHASLHSVFEKLHLSDQILALTDFVNYSAIVLISLSFLIDLLPETVGALARLESKIQRHQQKRPANQQGASNAEAPAEPKKLAKTTKTRISPERQAGHRKDLPR